MSFEKSFQDVADYLWKEYPAYNGWRIRSFAWEYDISAPASVIYFDITDKLAEYREIDLEDVEKHIKRVQPPEGYAFVILQKDDVRVGFNVPVHVFQGKRT